MPTRFVEVENPETARTRPKQTQASHSLAFMLPIDPLLRGIWGVPSGRFGVV
jgi:hypothetical protein